ncbi:MAG: trigger factor [Myxococcota bacterium]|nr:trigger factor [Myxococcota bacterium]
MSSIFKEISPVLTEIQIEISTDEIAKAVEKAFSELGRNARVPGFRRGKAPRTVLRRIYGQAVLADVTQDLVQTHAEKAYAEHGVTPLSRPEVDLGSLSEKEPFKFSIKFERRPKLDAVSFDGVEITRRGVLVEPAAVDKELERLRSAMADVVELESPRPARKGDMATVKLSTKEDEGWKVLAERRDYVVGAGDTVQEIEEALLDMNVGDAKDVELGGKEDGPPVRTLRVELLELRDRKIPELDDELAKDLGDFTTLAQLRDDIERRMLERDRQEEEHRLRTELFDRLRERNPFDLPPTLVKQQSYSLQLGFARTMASFGMESPEDEKFKELAERADKTAAEMVHQSLLLFEIARLHDIEVTPDDVEQSMKSESDSRGVPLPMVRAEYSKDEKRASEKAHLILEKKVFDFVAAKVKITDASA